VVCYYTYTRTLKFRIVQIRLGEELVKYNTILENLFSKELNPFCKLSSTVMLRSKCMTHTEPRYLNKQPMSKDLSERVHTNAEKFFMGPRPVRVPVLSSLHDRPYGLMTTHNSIFCTGNILVKHI